MFRRFFILNLVLFLFFAVPFASAESSFFPLLTLEERLQRVEASQNNLSLALPERGEGGTGHAISQSMTINGLIEMEVGTLRQRFPGQETVSSSDLRLATVQIDFSSQIKKETGVSLSLLYEEGGTLELDEAFICRDQGLWRLSAGRLYLPFGTFYSHFISDPQTLTLGETRKSAITLEYKKELLQLTLFAFNGREEISGREDHLNAGGWSITVTPALGIEFGASLLSDLSESDAVLLDGSGFSRQVPGWSVSAHLQEGALVLDGEYLAATKAFAAEGLDSNGDGAGDQPQTWNLEAVWLWSPEVELAARYGGSRELKDAPCHEYGIDLSWNPTETISYSCEYLRRQFDASFSTVTRSDQVTMQVALVF